MPLFDARDIIAFPGGDNSSDTIIGDVHLNKTSLDHWNYTLFSNGTLSNTSWCILTFPPYQPSAILDNGTFVNVTWCWSPVKPIKTRAGVGVGFAVLYGIGLLVTLLSLAKHGRLYLPAEKRFFPIGRRWQWYWGSFTCATALISLLTNIDVDRYFLPELPLILNCFFFFLMQIGAMALVWEAVRHWGSWMERQYIDPDPFALRQDDRRSKVELFLPLVCYLWLWMGFFLCIPRNWTKIQNQRYPQQIIDEAIPAATDGRFKAAAFMLFAAWLTTLFSLRHSVKHYQERNRGLINRTIGLLRFTPWRFIVLLPIALAIPAYLELIAWEFDYSPLNVDGNIVAIYVGGYLPSLLIIYIQAAFGYFNPNEDRELQRQRRLRGQALNAEMGIVNKPGWWRRLNSEGLPGENMRDILLRNVREINGGNSTTRNLQEPDPNQDQAVETARDEPVEMDRIPPILPPPAAGAPLPVAPDDFSGARDKARRYAGRSDTRRSENTLQAVSGLLFPGANEGPSAAARRHAELMMVGPPPSQPPPPYVERGSPQSAVYDDRLPTTGRSMSVNTTDTLNTEPQQIRSMLDV